jgi:hypothetical protein
MTLRSDRARTTARRAAAPPTLTLAAALTLQGWGARSGAGHPCHVTKASSKAWQSDPAAAERPRSTACFPGIPLYVKLGRRVVYDPADLDRWLASHRRASTSDEGEAA